MMYRNTHLPRDVTIFTPGLRWQKGRGYPLLKSQHGGNIFSTLFRAIVPAAKSLIRSTAAKKLGRKLVSHTAHFAGDLVEGKTPREAMESRLQVARREVGRALKRSGEHLEREPVRQHPPKSIKRSHPKKKIKRKTLKTVAKSDLFR